MAPHDLLFIRAGLDGDVVGADAGAGEFAELVGVHGDAGPPAEVRRRRIEPDDGDVGTHGGCGDDEVIAE